MAQDESAFEHVIKRNPTVDKFLQDKLSYIECRATKVRNYCFGIMFGIKTMFFPNLKIVDGYYSFYGCGARIIRMPEVTQITNTAFVWMNSLTDLYLPKLTYIKWDSSTYPWSSLKASTTIHFGKANEETIKSLDGYDNYFFPQTTSGSTLNFVFDL